MSLAFALIWFHRLLRHAVARAPTTAPSLAGVSPAATRILTPHGWQRKGPARDAVGKFTRSGLHHLESRRFPFWNGTPPSITNDVDRPSPTSGPERSIFRQRRDIPITRDQAAEVTGGTLVPERDRGDSA
jgi:hypothetical protein